MNSSGILVRQGHRLIQIGVAFFLFASFEGFAVHNVPAPRVGLSVHTLSAFSGVFMIGLGLVWPRLALGNAAAQAAFWLTIYSDFATVAAYFLAAIWGAGGSVIPLSAGAAHGTPLQELIVTVVLYSAAPTGITGFVLILWGLRNR